MGRVPGRAGRAALAALAFLLVPAPAAAQSISSPHALFKTSLNGAQIVISGGIYGPAWTNGEAGRTDRYRILDWPSSGAGSLSINSVTLNQSETTVTLTLAYTGDFTTDQSIRIVVTEWITVNGDNRTLSAIPVYAGDPSLVVGPVSGTVTEGGGQATFPVKLRTGPAGTVSVAVTSRDATEGAVSPSSLSFTTANWNTNQTVTVTGLDDAATDGDVDWDVRLDPSSTADSQYNALSHVDVAMTTVDDDGGPVVNSVTITSTPASGDTYEAGEAIEVQVGFDQSVAVTGIPRLALTIGTGTRPADYASGDGTTTLTFRYTVEADAADTDGIGIGANALTLNGGRIRQSGGTANAMLALGANTITNSASHKVDGSRGPPAVTGVSVGSPEVGDTFERGETIEATVTFNKAVAVTGTPRLALTIGTETRQAGYASGGGSTALTFRYTVVAADADTDGISIGANALTLNNGTIRRVGSSTVNAVLNIGGQAVSDSASHKVAGGSFTAPNITRLQIVSSPLGTTSFRHPATNQLRPGYVRGEVIELVITFSRPVEVTGTPLARIEIVSVNKNARYVSGTGTTSLKFQYTVAANDIDESGISLVYGPTLNGGAINDARDASQAADLSLPFSIRLADESNHRVDGRVVNTPAVTGVALDPPPKGDSFEGGERIEIAVTFDRAVNVTGTPRLALTIGTQTRQASYATGTGTRTLSFRYSVQAADADADGISIGASALALNGGSITLVGSAATNAALGLGTHAITDSTSHKVDGSVGAPRVVGVSIASPSTDDTFGRGEVIEVTVTFHQAVAVTGTPRLALGIGTETRQASYARGTGTTALVFSYTVVQADADTGGLGIAADALALNSGTITLDGSTATNAALGLGVYAIADSTSHKVDGSLGPPEITAVALSSPVVGDTFERGETIVATVTFNRKVDVTGAPRLALTIGSATRQASYATGTRTTALTFRYEVVQADVDGDGISVGASALTLNNGTIRLAGHGTINAGLGLGAQAITDSTSHKVAGGTFTAAAVSGVSITSTPAGAMTYVLGETIEVEVRFSRAVSVTGTPRLALGIGTETRQAAYAAGASTAQVLSFTYEVGAGDADPNGLSIAADALALNGGGIDDARDAAAPASLGLGANAVVDSASHRVDGSQGPPGVAAVALGSPAVGDTFERDDTIEATVTFNKAVDVTGTPRLALTIGAQTRQAGYASGDGSTALTFRYTVVQADSDSDGISVGSSALTLNGGAIRQAGSSTVNAVLGLGTRAVTDSVSHKVDGARITPSAAIGSTSPSPLAEGNLDGATVTVTLAKTTFESGVGLSSFTLNTNVPGLSIGSVAPVGSGDTTATLTLSYPGTNFDTPRTLSVTVAASAHALAGNLVTGTVPVAPAPGVAVSAARLALAEAPGEANANVGAWTVVLESPPGGNVTVTATSADAAVHVDTDGTPLTRVLTFTPSDWATAQTVTATAQADADAADESVAVTHAVSGYAGVTSAPTVTVAVDDDETAGVVLDADPDTTGVDEAGPLALDELPTSTNRERSYTVRLASPPTVAVTVTITSGDTGAVTVNDTDGMPGIQNTLAFTASTWGTAQTVTLRAVQDADAGHESVTVTHAASTASGSEYTGVSATLEATVVDDEAPVASITATSPTPLTAATLGGATLTVTLANATFESGVTTGSFELVTAIAGVSVSQVSSVTSGDTTATLTLAFSGGFSRAEALAVKVLAAAHSGSGDLTTGPVTVIPPPGIAVSPETATAAATTTLRTGEDGAQATFTVQLATEPAGDVVLDVASSDTGEGTVDTDPDTNGAQDTLTFTTTTWNSAQTVTVTGVDDATADGPRDYTVTLEVDQASTADGNYDALSTVTVYLVNDDDDATPDVNGDGDVDYEDALLMYYTYTAPILADSEFGPELRRILFRNLRGGRTDDAAGYLALLTAAGDWKATAAGDLNLDGDVDYQDALLMYYTYTAPILGDAEFGPGLRSILFRNLRGSRDDDTAGYLAILDAAKALVTDYGSGP